MAKQIKKISDLTPDNRNANKGTVRGLAMLEDSLQKYGAGRSILIDKNGNVIAGNKTLERAAELGIEVEVVQTDGNKLVAVQRTDLDLYADPKARELAYADNRVAEVDLAWDAESLLADMNDGVDLAKFFDQDELDALLANVVNSEQSDGVTPEIARKTLVERFIVPPFSVLDARQGYWQERKRAWIALGIQSELGRGDNAGAMKDSKEYPSTLAVKRAYDGKTKGLARTFGQDLMRGEHTVGAPKAIQTQSWIASVKGDDFTGLGANQSGTSIFDPVLCELAYRWFCPPNGVILDPFAGGSVRGVVAAMTGRRYTGVDLRSEQIEANRVQASVITPDAQPNWIVGDSRNVKTIASNTYDFIFSCPPYFDLEIYSDDKNDLSNTHNYERFIEAYRLIVKQSVDMLKDNRFACFVVGDIRDNRGMYRNFVSDTIDAFQNAGLSLYNEAILITSVGSLPIRVAKQFSSGRKLGKTHQNVLVFVKGDPRKATDDCGEIEVTVPDQAEA
jgi:DNA modification methylase